MNNFLSNGSILPHGLLNNANLSSMAGFQKSYQNFGLRVGVITEIYPVSDDKNKAQLTTEYDVLVMEQNEDRGATSILYRNCMAAESLGSIADYFEKTLRVKKKKTTKGDAVDLKGQNGAIVLLLCLDGMSDKGIIVGQLTHPDRDTTLEDDSPHLEGEYNGVHVLIEKEGNCTLTFKGATDNDGVITDSSQGPTEVKIEKDGSVEVNHKESTFRLDKSGDVTLTTSGDVNVKADGDVVLDGADAKLKLSKGKVALGGSQELLDLFDQTLKQMDAILTAIESLTVGTGVGPSSPPINVASFVQAQTEVATIKSKLGTIKGEL